MTQLYPDNILGVYSRRGLNSPRVYHPHMRLVLLLLVANFAIQAASQTTNNVTWTSPGHNENDSMPIGNGDLAANVWTEDRGDLVLLLAKSDAWTELGKLVKLGRIRIHLAESPFAAGKDFTQTLNLENGSIQIRSGENVLHVWIDANHPTLHIDAHLQKPTGVNAKLEVWRTTTHPYNEPSPDKGGFFEVAGHALPLDFEADKILPATGQQLVWCHFNRASIYPLVLKQEHLESLIDKYPDPLLHRCFGVVLYSSGLAPVGDQELKSVRPIGELHLNLTALTTTQTPSIETWQTALNRLLKNEKQMSARALWPAHQQWWREFWNRSWIHITGTPAAEKVSQGYVMQRYMMAASSRGAFPTKFNGGLFTVGHDMPADRISTAANHDPDFREWGNSYWNQNNRLLYWPLLQTGDFDLLKPWFAMYVNALPLAEDRTQQYFHHSGAAFIETMNFWGLPNINDFGWDNQTTEVQSRYMRYHIQGTLEVIAQMLDQYGITQDESFARRQLLPFANAILTYYAQHWARDASGHILMSPAQSIETYQLNAVNPTPDIAGLRSILPRLLNLPQSLATQVQRSSWQNLLTSLPPIPIGQTANGKLPPLAKGDPDGTRVILPAQSYNKPSNVENPELYVAFPYRLYGVGKPDLILSRHTFSARLFPQDTCWGQDGPQAATLGLTEVAKTTAIHEFTNYGDQRFQWFWKAGHDWIPDLDNGGSGMITLQLMLMQTEGTQILLLPAWPSDWTADFKLHAPFKTTVEGHVENGAITNLKVTPAMRAKDVVIATAATTK